MIRFLHTADWHLGYFFHENKRSHEHQQFCMKVESSFIDEGFGSLDSTILNITND